MQTSNTTVGVDFGAPRRARPSSVRLIATSSATISPESEVGGPPHGRRPMFQMERVIPGAVADLASNPIVEALRREAAGDPAGARELLTDVLARDLRCLEAHAHLGDYDLRYLPTLALRRYELGVAIAALSVRADFDGVLPWELPDNRPFLRCLYGRGRALLRLGRRDAAAEAFRQLVRVDPADHLRAREPRRNRGGKTWDKIEDTDR